MTMGFPRLNACVVSYCMTARSPKPLGPDPLTPAASLPHIPDASLFSEPASCLSGRCVHCIQLLTPHSERLLVRRLQGRRRPPFPCQALRDPAAPPSHTVLPSLVSAAAPRVFLWHKQTLAAGLPRNSPLILNAEQCPILNDCINSWHHVLHQKVLTRL